MYIQRSDGFGQAALQFMARIIKANDLHYLRRGPVYLDMWKLRDSLIKTHLCIHICHFVANWSRVLPKLLGVAKLFHTTGLR